MPNNREQMIEKLQQDHVYMDELIGRIRQVCERSTQEADCRTCDLGKREPCQMNIDYLIRTLADLTQRHHMIESVYMSECAPREHFIAHNHAHQKINEGLRTIRSAYKESGNGLIATRQISELLNQMTSHLEEFDQPMTRFMLEA